MITGVRWFTSTKCVGIVQIVQDHQVEDYRQTGLADFKYYVGVGWGEGVRNDSYDTVWFPNIHDDDPDDGWGWVYEKAERFATERHKDHSDPKWACDLVTAVRKMLKDMDLCKDPDGEEVVIWFSW